MNPLGIPPLFCLRERQLQLRVLPSLLQFIHLIKGNYFANNIPYSIDELNLHITTAACVSVTPHSTSVQFDKMERKAVMHSLTSLLPKFTDPDPDIRYMSLNDIHTTLEAANPSFLVQESHLIGKLAEGLLRALEDQHGEVQNQALKWWVVILLSSSNSVCDIDGLRHMLICSGPFQLLPPCPSRLTKHSGFPAPETVRID